MAFEDSDRRRTTLLGILTLLALPAIFFFTRADDTDAVNVDGVEISADGTPTAIGGNSPSRPPLVVTDSEPAFLDGTPADPNADAAEVAVPARPLNEPIRLAASYRSTISGVRSCLVRGLTTGLTITVTNLDNGRSITCVTTTAPFSQTADMVMHTDTFSLLADLTEAPIAVEITQ